MRKISVVLSTLVLSSTSFAALNCEQVPQLMNQYLKAHVSVREMNDEIRGRIIEQYIKSLDPTKSLLLEEDVKSIREDLKTQLSKMATGNCSLLTQIQSKIVARSEEAEKVVKKILDDKYKLDETVELQLDPEKRKQPTTLTERDELLRRFVHFQISNYLLAKTKLPEAKKLLAHRYELMTKRLKERSLDKLVAQVMKSFAYSLDPHTAYTTKEEHEDFKIDMRLSLDGIGASLSSQDGYTIVEEIISGGAADRAKVLKPKDKIIAVAQSKGAPVNVIDMELSDVVRLIRGKKGSNVTLTVLRENKGTTERLEFSIVRDRIQLKDAEAKLTFETRKHDKASYKLAVIELPSFYGEGGLRGRSSYKDIKKLIKKATEAKADGVLLNLMRNGGGLLEDAIRISGLFIKEGNIVATKNSQELVEKFPDDDDGEIDWNGPLVVLTSRMSASASEILAGALRDYKRAVIVGADHTFGKGTVQSVVELPIDLGAVKITNQMFFIPGGDSTQHQGVASHIVLPSVLNTDDFGEKALEYSLPPQKIPNFVSSGANSIHKGEAWSPLNDMLLKTLKANSEARIGKEPKFAEIIKDIAEQKENQGVIKLAELRKKSSKDSKKDDDKKSAKDRAKESEAPYLNEALNILAELVSMNPKELLVAPKEASNNRIQANEVKN